MASTSIVDKSNIATIKNKWSVERFHCYMRKYGVPYDVEPEYPVGRNTSLDASEGKITLNAN